MAMPSNLSFTRKIDPSYALLYSGAWTDRAKSDAWSPVSVQVKAVLGSASHKIKEGPDTTKKQMRIESPNPQTVDHATLPNNADTLKVNFTMRVIGGAITPSACNEFEFQSKALIVMQRYIDEFGFGTLAQRYAYNLANGRFLWRNRLYAENVEVQVRQLVDGLPVKSWTFDALDFSLENFDQNTSKVAELGALIADGLAGKCHVLLDVAGFARLGSKQTVYPSQDLVMHDKNDNDQKSKTLYVVDGIAGMHEQKLGNAICTIDNWYSEHGSPIAVQPYGVVTRQSKAYRPPGQDDFYTLFERWVSEGIAPEPAQQHFVMAMLVHGGVFCEKAEKPKKLKED